MPGMNRAWLKRMKRVALCWVLLWGLWGSMQGAVFGPEEAFELTRAWMQEHPLMGRQTRTIAAVETFPETPAGGFVYVIRLAPTGYIVVNSDDRLPLVVAFSTQSAVSLEAVADNAFRAFLELHVAQMAERIEGLAADAAGAASAEGIAAGDDELVDVLLETSWDQTYPYNLYAPADSGGQEYYGYRAPIGCVQTAYAQVMHYHAWPPYGLGGHAYTDTSGSLTGPHQADFTESYDWLIMRPGYSPWGTLPADEQHAVGDLLYDLAVAAEADFESSVTSARISDLGSRLSEHFHFEQGTYQSGQESLLPALDADLRAGYPAVVIIPGHAIVADGLLRHDGAASYHINYGWGGANNGWWAADAVPGGAISGGMTSIRPRLIPLPVQDTLTATAGSGVELQWRLPKRREHEAASLVIRELAAQPQPWTNDASSLGLAVNEGWSVVENGYNGPCWFSGALPTTSLTLAESFMPDASTALEFWMQYRLASGPFSISVSTDDGATFTEVFSRSDNWPLSWQHYSVPLGAFAGETIRLRFELGDGTWYTSGNGVWIDELALSSGGWAAWMPFAEDTALAARRFAATTTPWAACDDYLVFEKTSSSDHVDWTIATLDTGGTGFHKEAGGYGNAEYHLTSHAPITPGPATRLLLRARHRLAGDLLRVRVSADRDTFTTVWSGAGTIDWNDIAVPLGDYAGQAVYVRIEYVPGGYYPDGGVWIDSVATQEISHPELEKQPLHYTTLTDVPAGTYILAAAVEDSAGQAHQLSPPFTLTVTPGTSWRVTFDPGEHGDRSGGGELLQDVADGAGAIAPEIQPHPGWLFSGWDQPFDAIRSDTDVEALYVAKLAAAGTPHWWLMDHGLVDPLADDAEFDAAEQSDPIGKGYPLRVDYLAGTDPRDPASRFQVEAMTRAGSQLTLHWTGRAGRQYRVWRASRTDDDSWQEAAVLPCTEAESPMSHMESLPAGQARFFRLEVELTPEP
jgi:hypothetical protein